MSSELGTAVKRSLKHPGFVLVAGILLIGALGLNAATSFLNLFFRKEALPLRGELSTFTKKDLNGWVWVPEEQTLDPDTAHALGTDRYIMCTFIDTMTPGPGGSPVASRKDVEALANLKPEQRAAKVFEYRVKNTYSVINVAITYYTGKVDTVPHVPDRCYVADGFQPTEYQEASWLLGRYENGADRSVPVRFIDFEDQTPRGQQNRCVGYFFQANGQYLSDPNQVRFKLQDLRTRYAYFAKIEVMTILPLRPGTTSEDPMRQKDRGQAAKAMQKFLEAALPEIEKVLPDWERANAKK
jgi:hypothetical protein